MKDDNNDNVTMTKAEIFKESIHQQLAIAIRKQLADADPDYDGTTLTLGGKVND